MKPLRLPLGSPGMMLRLFLTGMLLKATCGAGAAAYDWPCFHGPDHNNISRETNWLGPWPADGPRSLWKGSVGNGFSSVSVAGGRLYTMGVVAGQETVWCLDAATGSAVWKHSYPYVFKPQYYEGGSSVTPTVDGDAVYSLGQAGELICFEAATGKVRWTENVAKDLGLEVPYWGFGGSPLVLGNRLVLNAGSRGTALDKTTGKLIWTNGKGATGYSTAVPFSMAGESAVALFCLREVAGVEVQTGRVLWQYPWKTEYDANVADPVLADGKVFVSSSYKTGCALAQFDPSPVRELWRSKELESHINSAVLLDGFLYGVDGEAYKPASFKCLDWRTGAVKWSHKGLGLGALTAAEGKLIILSEKGELVIAAASPVGFKPLAQAQVLGGKCWTSPVLANGRLYCRNSKGDLVCLALRSP
jgi:outer membrane protein assembly factor BamB